MFLGRLFLLVPIENPFEVVHHANDLTVIRRIDWSNGDVSYSSEFTAVVQMLVFQTEEIPHESAEKDRIL